MQKKIWFTKDKEKYYIIPNNYIFQEGDCLINSTNKESKSVDKKSIVEFHVTKKQVHMHLEEGLENAMDTAKEAFMELKAFYDILAVDDPLRTKSTANKMDRYRHLVAEMLGIPAVSNNSGISKDQTAAELYKGIENIIANGQAEDSLQEVSGYLKKIATQLDKPENRQKNLDELISIITNELSKDSEKEKREMEKRIKKSAQDAISISLDKVGFEVFKGVKNN